uniref:Target of rapamycin complex 2 subunit MAPKAP1-like n=1 Tax=Phallusia mammillata TaxID=59560 RepID=A0A6F9DKH8_9ASCI|nr:target of rapamycin complex 2 subunit MAPKAP1-like [Phallusia mammillata]
MAMVDDPDWLLAHIQHSFITSDDTGMCEMVIQDNDLLTLEDHRKQMKEIYNLNSTKHKPTGSYGKASGIASTRILSETGSPSSEEGQFLALAPSPDIMSGWDFGIRRRSNTAQKLERIRKERQNRVKIKTVHWKDLPERFTSEHLDLMFEKKDKNREATFVDGVQETDAPALVHGENSVIEAHENLCNSKSALGDLQLSMVSEKSVPVTANVLSTRTGFDVSAVETAEQIKENQSHKTVSVLAKQLSEAVNIVHNPFKEYSKFDGRGHEGSTHTQKINMFVWLYGESAPYKSMSVIILSAGAKIADLVGLTCWQYVTMSMSPTIKRTDVQGFALHIAEDDGEVDYGFPPLENNEPVSKFSFPTLALVEKHQVGDNASDDGKFRESVFVRVNDYAGFSLIQVDDLSVLMSEVLRKAIKRRKGNKYAGRYFLEYMDKPGVVVDEDQTLDSTGCMEFYMLREHSARSMTSEAVPSNIDTKPNAKGQSVHFSNRLTIT